MSDFKQSRSRPRVAPEPRPRIGKSERTRAEIVNAVLDFTWSQPFADMTVSELMDLTSSSRSTFYAHFNDLHEAMEAVLDLLKHEIFDAEYWKGLQAAIEDGQVVTMDGQAGTVQVKR